MNMKLTINCYEDRLSLPEKKLGYFSKSDIYSTSHGQRPFIHHKMTKRHFIADIFTCIADLFNRSSFKAIGKDAAFPFILNTKQESYTG